MSEQLEQRTLLTGLLFAESNDVFAEAVPVVVTPEAPLYSDSGFIGDGPFPFADVDMLQIELSGGDRVTIDVDSPIGPGAFDSVIRVFDGAAIERGVSDDNPAPGEAPSLEAFLDFIAPHTGTYFIGLSAFPNFNYDPIFPGSGDPGSTGAYDVHIELMSGMGQPGGDPPPPEGDPPPFPPPPEGDPPFPPPPEGDPPSFPPPPEGDPPPFPEGNDGPPLFGPERGPDTDTVGDDAETAGELLLDEGGAGFIDGVIDTAGDVDVYRIEVAQNGLLRIRQTASPGSFLDTFVRVFNSNGQPVAQNDDDGVSLNSLVQFPVSAGAEFFVEAGAFADSTGEYRVTIDLANAAADDVGNDIDSAALFPLDPSGQGQRFGEIESSGDRDVFRVTATRTGLLGIRQRAVPGSPLDTFLRVRDDRGVELIFNDDDGQSLNSFVQVPVVEGQTLFLEAGAFGASRGRYELVVSAGAPVRDDAGDSIATSVTLPTRFNGRLIQRGRTDRPGDRDVFQFTPSESGRLIIRQRAEPGVPLDTFLRVLGTNGQQLAANDDDGFSLNSRVSVPVTAGQAIFIEAGAFGQSVGDYVIEIESDAEAIDDFGNDIASANVAGGAEFRGQIEASGDVDVFRVQAGQTGLLTIRQRAARGSSLDSFLRVLDSSGSVLATNDDDRFSLNSVVTVSVTAGDTIFVEAGAFSTSTGRYVVTVSADSDDFGGDLADTATLISVNSDGNGSQRGSINFDTDVDVFRLVPDRDAVVTIDLAAGAAPASVAASGVAFAPAVDAAGGSTLDTFIEILSSDQEVILVDDDGGDGLNSRVTFDVKSGETYFLRASSFGGTTGRYELSVSSTFEVDDVGNTFPDARLVVLDENGAGTTDFTLANRSDVDVFQFVATASGDATVQVSSENDSVPGNVLIFADTDEADGTQRNRVRVARDSDGDGAATFTVVEGSTYFVEVGQGAGSTALRISTDTTVTEEAKIDDDVAGDAADLFRLGLASILVGETDDSALDVFSATLEETAEFLRDKLGTDEPLLILGLDPVDYIVTDAAGRQAGFTATDGEVNEVGSNVFNSGDGVAELLVIANPSAEVFQLELVGVGTEFRGGAAFVDSSGVQTTTFDGTLTKGNLEVALDFTDGETTPAAADGEAVAAPVQFFASVSDPISRSTSQTVSNDSAADVSEAAQASEAAAQVADGLSEVEQSGSEAGPQDGALPDGTGELIDSLMDWLTESSPEEQDADLVDRAWASLSESILEISSGALELLTDLLATVDQELPEEKQAVQEPAEDAEETQAAKKADGQQRTAEGAQEKSTAEAKPEEATDEKPVTTARVPVAPEGGGKNAG